jgi:hypothetical protein
MIKMKAPKKQQAEEKIIQISMGETDGSYSETLALSNRGRIFCRAYQGGGDYLWQEIRNPLEQEKISLLDRIK